MTSANAPSALRLALVLYGVALAVVLLAPTGDLPSTLVSGLREPLDGVAPAWLVEPHRFQLLVNALVVAPPVALAVLIWPRWGWRDWTALAFCLACAVEVAQALVLPDRSADAGDVVANTLGALAGAAAVGVVRVVVAIRRSQRP